ncbi:MAG: 1-acyl-sn-glycerol-3-phosphate acyltransferase [Lachnospiraceae bacterium]|nr:1-acyl-sn-glycerol-3-phosphate acyltransferase [Lachnospiraceae bacterium]
MAREDRLRVLARIREYEAQGRFNEDVEEDAPAAPIKPGEVDYTGKKLSSKAKTKVANFLGKAFFENMIRKNKLIIKEVHGLENATAVTGGAIVTSNHFHLSDNYAVYRTIKPALKRRHYLYKVIKESNYTNFKGPVRIMMRHANTLPLSSNHATMREFFAGMKVLLDRGEKILIYPEQAMWFNYRKPRPLKVGAFKFAAKFNVPVIPVFICMKDSDVLDDDGFPVQELYVHYLPAIYPDNTLTVNENAQRMMDKNSEVWTEVYETFYQEKLVRNQACSDS